MTTGSRSRRDPRNALLLLGSVLAAALLAEGVLRLVLPAPIRWKHPQETYIFDPEIGHGLAQQQRAYTHDQRVVTNKHGLRDRDYPELPSPDTVRLAAVGDSQTFGNGLNLDATWPKQLERVLNEDHPASRYEVLNCGIPGTDTWQHEILVRRVLKEYHPSVVVVAVYPNDVTPSFHPDPERAMPTGSWRKRAGYFVKGFELSLVVIDAVRVIEQRTSPSADSLHERAILTGEADPVVERGWEQVDRSLAAMERDARASQVRLVILTIPRRDEISGTEKGRAFQDRVRGIAEAHGIPWVDPLGALEDEFHKTGAGMFLAWDGHNSRITNEVIARELGREIALATERTGP